MRIILAVVWMVVWTAAVDAKTLYVNSSGSPACSDVTSYASNAAGSPWCSIGRAAWGSTSRSSPNSAEAAAAGDTVLVTAGTYTITSDVTSCAADARWQAALNPANSGSAGNLITFQASGTVLVQLASGSRGPTIGAYSRSYIVWNGFSIDESTAVGQSCQDTGPVVVNTCTGCRITGNTIKGTTKTGWGDNYNGVRVEGTADVRVDNNEIYNFNCDTASNCAGVMLYDAARTIIENNYIHNQSTGIYVKGDHLGDGLPQEDTIVRKNWIQDHTSYGVHIVTGAGTRVTQNVIKTCYIEVHLLGDAANINVKIVNNTLIGTAGEIGAGFSMNGDATTLTGFQFFNNICSLGDGECVNFGTLPSIGTSSFEHNLYFGYTNFGSLNSATTTLANWKTNTSQDSAAPASANSDPSFASTTYPGGYKLNGGSPALTLGVDILDLDGDSSTSDTVPAGAYITGSETIGTGSGGGGGGSGRAPRLRRFRPGE